MALKQKLCCTMVDTLGRELMIRRQVSPQKFAPGKRDTCYRVCLRSDTPVHRVARIRALQIKIDESGWPVHEERFTVTAGQQVIVTTRVDAVASGNVLPITYERFTEMAEPGEGAFVRGCGVTGCRVPLRCGATVHVHASCVTSPPRVDMPLQATPFTSAATWCAALTRRPCTSRWCPSQVRVAGVRNRPAHSSVALQGGGTCSLALRPTPRRPLTRAGPDVFCVAKNNAVLEGLLTVFHTERSTDTLLNVQNTLPLLSQYDKEAIEVRWESAGTHGTRRGLGSHSAPAVVGGRAG